LARMPRAGFPARAFPIPEDASEKQNPQRAVEIWPAVWQDV